MFLLDTTKKAIHIFIAEYTFACTNMYFCQMFMFAFDLRMKLCIGQWQTSSVKLIKIGELQYT